MFSGHFNPFQGAKVDIGMNDLTRLTPYKAKKKLQHITTPMWVKTGVQRCQWGVGWFQGDTGEKPFRSSTWKLLISLCPEKHAAGTGHSRGCPNLQFCWCMVRRYRRYICKLYRIHGVLDSWTLWLVQLQNFDVLQLAKVLGYDIQTGSCQYGARLTGRQYLSQRPSSDHFSSHRFKQLRFVRGEESLATIPGTASPRAPSDGRGDLVQAASLGAQALAGPTGYG